MHLIGNGMKGRALTTLIIFLASGVALLTRDGYGAQQNVPSTSIPTKAADPTVRQLEREPVSMFDWGLELMQRDLQEIASGPEAYFGRAGALPPEISVVYVPSDNKIWFSIYSEPYTERSGIDIPSKPHTPENWCGILFGKLRATLGSYVYPGLPPHWIRYFIPQMHTCSTIDSCGSTTDADPRIDTLMKTLPKMIFLRAQTSEEQPDGGRMLTCSGPLAGEDMRIERGNLERPVY